VSAEETAMIVRDEADAISEILKRHTAVVRADSTLQKRFSQQ
jgi:hypothetical protein